MPMNLQLSSYLSLLRSLLLSMLVVAASEVLAKVKNAMCFKLLNLDRVSQLNSISLFLIWDSFSVNLLHDFMMPITSVIFLDTFKITSEFTYLSLFKLLKLVLHTFAVEKVLSVFALANVKKSKIFAIRRKLKPVSFNLLVFFDKCY